MDYETNELLSTLQRLLSTRNTCQPSLQLPPEVFEGLTNVLASICPAQCDYLATSDGKVTWIALYERFPNVTTLYRDDAPKTTAILAPTVQASTEQA